MQLHAPVNTKPLHSDFVKEVDIRVSERLDDPDTIRQLKDTFLAGIDFLPPDSDRGRAGVVLDGFWRMRDRQPQGYPVAVSARDHLLQHLALLK